MNFIKSVFIGFMPMLLMLVIGFAINDIIRNGFGWTSVAALLSSLPIMLFILWLVIFKSHARTSASLPIFSILTLSGIAMMVWYIYISQPLELNQYQTLVILLAGISALLYVFWYSSLGRQKNKILSIGKTLPDFTLYDYQYNPIRKQQLINQFCIFIFYRGNWCPFCVAQIKELVQHYQQLDKIGVNVILVSPQSEAKTKKLAEKFEVPFLFLIDKNTTVAKTLGIRHLFGLPMGLQVLGYSSHTVFPTVIVVDADGKIIYTDENNNYRIRPEPSEYIKILQQHMQADN